MIELCDFDPLEPIIASKYYREKELNNRWSEAYYYKLLERACKEKKLIRLCNGMYCRPKFTPFDYKLTNDDIVELFTASGRGFEVGEKLFCDKGVMIGTYTSRVVYTSQLRDSKMKIGGVLFVRYEIEYTHQYTETIAMLEVCSNYYKMGTLDHTKLIQMYIRFCQSYNDEIAREVIEKVDYPIFAISFLRMILVAFHIPNTLGDFLSSRSVYKHPTISEIQMKSDWDRRNHRRWIGK